MRVRVVSDLHFEFHKDHGRSLLREILEDQDFEVLIIAGDLSNQEGIYGALALVSDAISPKPLVFTSGNHELYGGNQRDAEQQVLSAAEEYRNLHVLENSFVELSGQRFIGCTLWYEHPDWSPLDSEMGDFCYIDGFDRWVHKKAKDSALYLRETIQPGDIVITHFLPHPQSIAPKFARSPINSYFLHNVRDAVEQGGAKLWVHGHTHCSLNYVVEKTWVVCNPFGYANSRTPGEPNPDWKPDFTVDV